MKKTLLLSSVALALLVTSCKKHNDRTEPQISYSDMAEASDPALLFEASNGVKVYNGGFGSAVVTDPNAADIFYLLTDRGPNAEGPTSDIKIFR
jgi:hypothetical protein